jgi:hypothetical protein
MFENSQGRRKYMAFDTVVSTNETSVRDVNNHQTFGQIDDEKTGILRDEIALGWKK